MHGDTKNKNGKGQVSVDTNRHPIYAWKGIEGAKRLHLTVPDV